MKREEGRIWKGKMSDEEEEEERNTITKQTR